MSDKNYPKKIVSLFNKPITFGCVPGEWKTAVVILVFKGGREDRRLPVNYQPFSLTSCVASVPENIVSKRLQEYLCKMYKHQSGFLSGHSNSDPTVFVRLFVCLFCLFYWETQQASYGLYISQLQGILNISSIVV